MFLFVPLLQLNAQGWLVQENNFETNWNVSFQLGRSALLNEVKKDFSGASNDMNNLSDWAYNFQLSKMIYERLDFGMEFGQSNFKGYKENPRNVNYLMLHHSYNNSINNFKPHPIYYDSDIINYSVFLKYNFINFSNFTHGIFHLNIYTKVALGLIFISSEMGYSDITHYKQTGLKHPLYSKGRLNDPVKSAHTIISPCLGLNYQLSERFFISFESSFHFLNADYIDGVHNFDNQLTPETPEMQTVDHRVQVYDLIGKFMFGVTFFFNFDTQKQERMKYLPWYHNRYRSYYSKFHQKNNKQERQRRLPFYDEKFEEN